MAERLARLYGTEQDSVNCAFFAKMGACRYGAMCKKNHHRPGFSPCLQIDHMYGNPVAAAQGTNVDIPKEVLQQHFDEFFDDVYNEMKAFGNIEQLNILANLGDHMMGNVYVLFDDEEASAKALAALAGRFYAGKPLVPEMSVVTDFHEARCRAYDESDCSRGGQCNFMHIMKVSPKLSEKLRYRPMDQRQQRGQERNPRMDPNARGGGDRDSRRNRSRSRDRRRDDRRSTRRRSRSRDKESRKESRRDRRRSRSPEKPKDGDAPVEAPKEGEAAAPEKAAEEEEELMQF